MAHQSETAIDPRFTGRERQPGLDLLRALAIIVLDRKSTRLNSSH